jgi:hypothetical protein
VLEVRGPDHADEVIEAARSGGYEVDRIDAD